MKLIPPELTYKGTVTEKKKTKIHCKMQISVVAGNEPKSYGEVIGKYEFITNAMCMCAGRATRVLPLQK